MGCSHEQREQHVQRLGCEHEPGMCQEQKGGEGAMARA